MAGEREFKAEAFVRRFSVHRSAVWGCSQRSGGAVFRSRGAGRSKQTVSVLPDFQRQSEDALLTNGERQVAGPVHGQGPGELPTADAKASGL